MKHPASAPRLALAAIALVLGACSPAGQSSSPSPSSAPSTPSASSGTSATPSRPSAEPSATATAPAFEGHPGAGLALVQFPDPGSPASQVFVVETDGSLRQVTGLGASSSGATGPVWSPDGTMLAIGPPKVGASGVMGQVNVINADGSGERNLGEGSRPLWSPDGTRLLVSEVDDVTSEPRSMWIVDVATGEITDLGQGFNSQWLPDGRIGFRRVLPTDDGSFRDGLFVMSPDGGEAQQLPTEPETEAFWSPDGSAMLLVHDGTISLAAPDGTAAEPLVEGFAPAWSPDGERVAFAYDFDEEAIPVLAVVNLEGETIWSGGLGQDPVWSPDGTRLAVEIPIPEQTILVLDAASGEVLWEVDGSEPAWRP